MRQKLANELHDLISVLDVTEMAAVLDHNPFHFGYPPEKGFDADLLSFVLLAVVNQRRDFDLPQLVQYAPTPQGAGDG